MDYKATSTASFSASPPRLFHQPVFSPCAKSADLYEFPQAVRKLCDAGQHGLLEAWLEPRFQQTFERIYGKEGWAEEAYVNYVSASDNTSLYVQETELLIESIHRFSDKPIVVVDFSSNGFTVPQWTPQRFPRLVVLHAKPMPPGVRFNYNKIRAMIIAHVKTGVMLDSDEFVFRGADVLFSRTRQEIDASYPWPIMPVHWMSRDSAGKDYAGYDFICPECPKRTMRWGHAHPTWTYHSLPFLADLLLGEFVQPRHLLTTHVRALEDEDAFNIGLWAVGATKQWCKFDIPFPSLFTKYISQDAEGLQGCCGFADDKWYPHGVPLVFYTAHAAKDPAETRRVMDALSKLGSYTPPQFFFNGSFYKSPKDIPATLPCLV